MINFHSFQLDLTKGLELLVNKKSQEFKAFSILATQLYAQRAESSVYGLFASHGPVNSARARAYPVGAENIRGIFDKAILGDEYAVIRKPSDLPYKDHSGQLSSSVEVDSVWDKANMEARLEVRMGWFSSKHPWDKGQNYFDFVDAYVGGNLLGQMLEDITLTQRSWGSWSGLIKETIDRVSGSGNTHNRASLEQSAINAKKFYDEVSKSKDLAEVSRTKGYKEYGF